MKVLFLSLLDFNSLEVHNIYTDLLREFYRNKHEVYIVSPVERKRHIKTHFLKTGKIYILKPRIGNIQKTNLLEKGISTISIESIFIRAIKKYFSNIKFDLILYTTPPITLQKVVKYIKERDGALAYLMLKDIFPQNAVDIEILSKNGIKGLIYRYFRRREKYLYKGADIIGCMSQANVDYIKKHNPEIMPESIEVCPNCIEPQKILINKDEKKKIRKRIGIPADKMLFIYGGNLGKPQGISFLIECLKKTEGKDNIFFLIIGNGTEYGKLRKYIDSEEPKNVKLMQFLPKKEYEKIVMAADIGMIFLDYRFTIPNFPSRILSYMDAGLPILAVTDQNTDIGKIIEEGEFGVSIESNDADRFKNAVEELASSDKRIVMGKNARRYLEEHYSVQTAYDTIMRHFEIE